MTTEFDHRPEATGRGRGGPVSRVLRLASMVLAVLGLSFPGVATGQADAGSGELERDAVERETSEADAPTGEEEDAEDSDRPAAARETSIHGGWLVIVAYLILWLAIMAYIVHLANRQKALTREIETLETRIDQILDDVTDEE